MAVLFLGAYGLPRASATLTLSPVTTSSGNGLATRPVSMSRPMAVSSGEAL